MQDLICELLNPALFIGTIALLVYCVFGLQPDHIPGALATYLTFAGGYVLGNMAERLW